MFNCQTPEKILLELKKRLEMNVFLSLAALVSKKVIIFAIR